MLPDDSITQAALDAAKDWYERKRAKRSGNVHFNVMAVGLAMSYFLRTAEFPLKEEDITAKNGAQVKGLNANFIQKRLKEHGVLGRTPVECGRTSRGTITIALELSKAINDALGSF